MIIPTPHPHPQAKSVLKEELGPWYIWFPWQWEKKERDMGCFVSPALPAESKLQTEHGNLLTSGFLGNGRRKASLESGYQQMPCMNQFSTRFPLISSLSIFIVLLRSLSPPAPPPPPVLFRILTHAFALFRAPIDTTTSSN